MDIFFTIAGSFYNAPSNNYVKNTKKCKAWFIGRFANGLYCEKEVSFELNRLFLFVLTSSTGIPLFVGIVNHPG